MAVLSPSILEPASATTSPAPSVTVTTPESLSNLIEKRTASWWYLQRAHSSSSERWFQTVNVSQNRIERYLGETLGTVKSSQRTRNLFVLGMSLGPMLEVDGSIDLCRSLNRVLDEWETWSEGGLSGKSAGVGTGVKNLFRNQKTARKSAASYTETTYDILSPNNGSHPSLSSAGTTGLGTTRSDSALITLNLPFALDYCQIVITLCEIIRRVYIRLGELALRPLHTGHVPSRDGVSSFTSSGNRSGLSPRSNSFSGARTAQTPNGSNFPADAQHGVLGNIPGNSSGRTVSYGYNLGIGTGNTAASGTWSPALADQITKTDQKLKKLLVSFTRDMEHIARTAVNEELSSLLRGLGTQASGSAVFEHQQRDVLNLLHEPGVLTG